MKTNETVGVIIIIIILMFLIADLMESDSTVHPDARIETSYSDQWLGY